MSNVDSAKAAYDAFSSGDMDTLRGFYADDAEWWTSEETPLGGLVSGADAIIQNFTELPQYWSEFSVSPDEFIDGGETVVVLGTIRGTAAEGSGSFESPYAHVLRYNSDGKLTRGDFHSDTAKEVKAQGGG